MDPVRLICSLVAIALVVIAAKYFWNQVAEPMPRSHGNSGRPMKEQSGKISTEKHVDHAWQRDCSTSPQHAEADAKSYLNALRQNELSVGAAMRRGEQVPGAPGQTRSSKSARPGPHAPAPARSTSSSSATGHTKMESTTDEREDFAMSMAVGMATGSALAGFAAGGSFAGGAVGVALDNSCNDSSDSSDTED